MNESPQYVTCHCQHCGGGIEFDANQLAAENYTFTCPHCELQTPLYIPTGQQNPPPIQKTETPTLGYWQKVLQQKNATGRFKSARVTLTKAQSEIPIAKELIALLVEIEKDGFVEDAGARRLTRWLEERQSTEIPAFQFLLDISKDVLSYGKLTTVDAPKLENALQLQTAIERVLPKHFRDPITAKRREVEERFRQQMPASEGMLDRIRELGGKPKPGMTSAEAYELKEKLYHQPTEAQLDYIRSLGGHPSPALTRESASLVIQELLSGHKATDRQIEYIRNLGGNPPPGLSHVEASEIIQKLLAIEQPTPRQIMVLRFWNRLDLAQSSKHQIEEWLTQFYDEDPRRKAAWEIFKVEIADDGSQHDPSIVPIGAGQNYLS